MTSLSALVDRVADRAPESEAFCSPAGRLTYAEMAEATSRLANLLADEGVRRGDRVGIFMPRCLESAIAVYGILKCGGAFVPMDPLTPEDGLRRLIHDCDLRVIVTTRQQARALAETARGESPLQCVVGLDEPLDGSCRTRPWDDLPQYSDAAPDVAIEPDDLAYIMYSSGSTGRPKGIQHTHHSGSSYARLSVATYDVRPEDRIGNHSPLHFDMSTFGYFSGPMAGATTLLVPEAYTKMAASLSQLIESERLTIWYSVPLALIQLLSRGVLEERDLSSLRWVLFGGEPFPPKHLRELMRRWPQARFSNVYGPAEVNQCTYYHVPPLPDADDELAPIPIGEIWAETDGLILDEDDRILEGAEVGELVVHSPTMMRGYWRRPDLNARAFFRSDRDGVSRTYYRTGDLVRRDADGRLLFLGRKDRQLKVRGYRVELDEIEHLLAGHPVVEEAAAYPVRLGDEIDHIEASVTAVAGASIDVDDLQTLLSRQLSWYAVPKRIDIVESFPRTTSGKIDRRRLQLTAEAEGDAAS